MKKRSTTDEFYRSFIDRLVRKAQSGAYEAKLRSGTWNANATADFVPEDHRVNLLLAQLDPDQRQDLARILTQAYVAGLFDVLVALYENEVQPFDKGYECDPFHDFIGRLDGWEWPEGQERSG